MPTTRAARRAARCLTEVLPADALGLVLYQLPLAHDIAAVAPTCHVLCDAAKLARKLRPFSGEVVTLAGHANWVWCVAVAPDGRIVTVPTQRHDLAGERPQLERDLRSVVERVARRRHCSDVVSER